MAQKEANNIATKNDAVSYRRRFAAASVVDDIGRALFGPLQIAHCRDNRCSSLARSLLADEASPVLPSQCRSANFSRRNNSASAFDSAKLVVSVCTGLLAQGQLRRNSPLCASQGLQWSLFFPHRFHFFLESDTELISLCRQPSSERF